MELWDGVDGGTGMVGRVKEEKVQLAVTGGYSELRRRALSRADRQHEKKLIIVWDEIIRVFKDKDS